MKKILWIVCGFFVVLLVAAIAIPLFVSVDRYRPEIQAEANKRINGKLELGKLSLSLWGKVRIHAESIRVTVNGFPQALLDTKDFHVELPIGSLIAGKPQVIAVLDSPRIEVIKELDGRMNVLELMKVAGQEGCATGAAAPSQTTAVVATASSEAAGDTLSTTASAPERHGKKENVAILPREVKKAPKVTTGAPALAPAAPAPVVPPATPAPVAAVPAPCPPASSANAGAGEPMRVPSLLAGATLGLRVENGDVVYLDKVSKSDYRVNGLNIDARNIGMGSTMDLKIKAPLKGQMPFLTFDGPVEANAQITPVLVGTSVKAAKGDFYIDASPLKLEIPGKFKKPAGMPLVLKGKLGGNEKETSIEVMELNFHDFKIFAKGRVALQPLTARLDFSADPIKLGKAREFVPLMAEYDVKGIATFNAKVALDPTDLKVTGGIRVADGSLFPKAYLKAPLLFQAQAAFSENSVNLTRASFTGPDSDLQVVGNLKNFLSPVFSFNVTGASLNVDKTIVLPGAPAVGKDGKPVAGSPAAPAKADPSKPDVNPMAEFAKNPMFAKAEGAISADIGKVTVYGSVLEKLSARAGLKDMNLRLNDATLRTYGGTVRTEGNFNLGAASLPFTSQGNVAGISGADAFRTYFPKFQNTVAGSINAQWNVNGGLYPAATRLRSLGGSAKLLATDGVLKSVDVQSTINQVMKKVPFLKDRQPLEIDDGFKTLSAEIRFNGGEVRVDPIEVQPRNKGFVLKGKSTIQENLSQETFLDVFDPQGRLPRDIQRPGKPAISLRLTGPLAGPTPDYEYTVKKLATNGAQNALKNVAGKALDKLLGSPKEGEKGNALQDAARKLKEKFKLKL